MYIKAGNETYTIMWNSDDTTNYMRERIAKKIGIIEVETINMQNASGVLLHDNRLLRMYNMKDEDTITWGVSEGG